jgi:hypothetical protein
LEVDYDSLSILLKKTEEGIKSITYLDSLLNQNLSSYSNSMDTLFGAVYGFRFFSYS